MPKSGSSLRSVSAPNTNWAGLSRRSVPAGRHAATVAGTSGSTAGDECRGPARHAFGITSSTIGTNQSDGGCATQGAPDTGSIEHEPGRFQLCPGSTAEAADFMSLRSLHNKFHGSRAIASPNGSGRERPQQCCLYSTDAFQQHVPVGAIGARWGLPDAAHFSRVFPRRIWLLSAIGVPRAKPKHRDVSRSPEQPAAGPLFAVQPSASHAKPSLRHPPKRTLVGHRFKEESTGTTQLNQPTPRHQAWANAGSACPRWCS